MVDSVLSFESLSSERQRFGWFFCKLFHWLTERFEKEYNPKLVVLTVGCFNSPTTFPLVANEWLTFSNLSVSSVSTGCHLDTYEHIACSWFPLDQKV